MKKPPKQPRDMFIVTLEYILSMPRTKRQVEQYLRRKMVERDEAETIMARLEELGYLNDAIYTEMFVESKSKKMGKNAIKNKLFMRGVNSELVEQGIAEVGDQTELARYTAEKYMRSKVRDIKNFQKLYNHLVTKGFEYDTVRDIVTQMKHGGEHDPQDWD